MSAYVQYIYQWFPYLYHNRSEFISINLRFQFKIFMYNKVCDFDLSLADFIVAILDDLVKLLNPNKLINSSGLFSVSSIETSGLRSLLVRALTSCLFSARPLSAPSQNDIFGYQFQCILNPYSKIFSQKGAFENVISWMAVILFVLQRPV